MSPYFSALQLDSPDQFPTLMRALGSQLLITAPVHIGEWHSKDTSQNKYAATYELLDVTIHTAAIDYNPAGLAKHISPNLPWADEHFEERVGGKPVNPPPSHEHWPWASYNASHLDGTGKFSHSYPERMWPRRAGYSEEYHNIKSGIGQLLIDQRGIRFRLGDLNDVVNMLVERPLTRQAYLPIWFPEDTGAVSHQRVPCSLGYHFMIRHGKLSMRYYMRSCDLIRHFADDYYMAARLLWWVYEQVIQRWDAAQNEAELSPGDMTVYISSLHAFLGDQRKLEALRNG